MKSIRCKGEIIDCFLVGDLKYVENIISLQDFLSKVFFLYKGNYFTKIERWHKKDDFETYYDMYIEQGIMIDNKLICDFNYVKQGEWILVDKNKKITIISDEDFQLYYTIIDEK